jgi:3-hydroxyacyl-CoA dehydrogenase
VQRVFYPLVNEGFKILEENIARCPSDIDVVYMYGYGWPAWKGGPMFWGDTQVGLPTLLHKLEEFSRKFPDTDHYQPSALLRRCVDLGVTVEEYYSRGLHQPKQSRL